LQGIKPVEFFKLPSHNPLHQRPWHGKQLPVNPLYQFPMDQENEPSGQGSFDGGSWVFRVGCLIVPKAATCHTIDAHDINNFICVSFNSFCLEDINPTIKGCSEEGSRKGVAGVWNDEILIITL
jgi:hypothetical protein